VDQNRSPVRRSQIDRQVGGYLAEGDARGSGVLGGGLGRR